MIIVISGSRTVMDNDWLYACLDTEIAGLLLAGLAGRNDAELEFRVGDAKGIDAMAASWCSRNSFSCTMYEAQWATEGNAAGPLRNWAMVKGPPKADLLLAFWSMWSAGTRNAIASAINQGVECRVRMYPEEPQHWMSGPDAIKVALMAGRRTLRDAQPDVQPDV